MIKKYQLNKIIKEEIKRIVQKNIPLEEHNLKDTEVRIPFGLEGTHNFHIANIGTGKVKVGKEGIVADNNTFVSWREIRDLMDNYEGL